jgi:hypothetical protein
MALLAGLDNTILILLRSDLRAWARFRASIMPLVLSGLSKSLKSISPQSDLAWRSTNNVLLLSIVSINKLIDIHRVFNYEPINVQNYIKKCERYKSTID